MAGLSVEGDALDRLGTDQLLDLKRSIDARLKQQRGITEGRDNLSQGGKQLVLRPTHCAQPASLCTRPPHLHALCTGRITAFSRLNPNIFSKDGSIKVAGRELPSPSCLHDVSFCPFEHTHTNFSSLPPSTSTP